MYKIPRLAIRMKGNNIEEVRGIAVNQNIEPNMEKILEVKLKEFPDGDKYQKKVNDMKTLTDIYNKHLNGEELTKEELQFIYEIYDVVEGFGSVSDPRIKEIIKPRNNRKDLAYALDCNEEQLVLTIDALDLYNGEIDISKIIYCCLSLEDEFSFLTDLEGEELVFPRILKSGINLAFLSIATGVVFPEVLHGDLILSGLLDPQDLVLPKIITGYLYLTRLESLVGVKLPEKVGKEIIIYGDAYSLEEVIEMQRQEEQLRNSNPIALKRTKQEGFISNTIIILNIILFGVLCFILTLLIIR